MGCLQRRSTLALVLTALVQPLPSRGEHEATAGGLPPAPTIRVSYSYGTNLATNPLGGVVPGSATYTDNHLLTFSLPLQITSTHLRSATLVVEAYDRNGTDLSATAIGNQFTVQQLYGVETAGLYSLRLEADLPRLGGSLKLGRFSSGDDFATWPTYGLAMNNAINGNPQSLPVNTGFSSFPNAVWGAWADASIGGDTSLRLGTFQITEPDVPRYHGFNWAIRPSDGLLLISQLEHCRGCPGIGWAGQSSQPPPAAVASVLREEPSYPVHEQRLAVGGYWSLRPQTSWEGADVAASTYGGWLHADRTLWRAYAGGPALAIWGSLTSSPQPSVVRMPLYWALGLVRYGLEARRPQDSAMVALYQGRFSPASMRSLGSTDPEGAHETVIELGYRRRLGSTAFLQPNLQVVIHPSGLHIPSALVIGLQTGISF
ncbi:MAG: carbohydrate porin [Cyanobium sp.]